MFEWYCKKGGYIFELSKNFGILKLALVVMSISYSELIFDNQDNKKALTRGVIAASLSSKIFQNLEYSFICLRIIR